MAVRQGHQIALLRGQGDKLLVHTLQIQPIGELLVSFRRLELQRGDLSQQLARRTYLMREVHGHQVMTRDQAP